MSKTRKGSYIGNIKEQLLNSQSGSSEAQQSSYADELLEVQSAGVVSANKEKKPTPQKQKELTPSEQRAADAKARREEALRLEQAKFKELSERGLEDTKAKKEEALRLEQARIMELNEQRIADAKARREEALRLEQTKFKGIVARDEERQESARGLVEERILDTKDHNLNRKEGFYDRHMSGSNSPRSPRGVSEFSDDEISETQSQISEADRAQLSLLKSRMSRARETQNQSDLDLGVGAVAEDLPEASVLRDVDSQILTVQNSEMLKGLQTPTPDELAELLYEEEEVEPQDLDQIQRQQQNLGAGTAGSSLLGDLPSLERRSLTREDIDDVNALGDAVAEIINEEDQRSREAQAIAQELILQEQARLEAERQQALLNSLVEEPDRDESLASTSEELEEDTNLVGASVAVHMDLEPTPVYETNRGDLLLTDVDDEIPSQNSASAAAVASASSLVEDEPAEAEETTVVEEGVPEVREEVDLEETLAATSSASVAAVASASSLVENEAAEVEEATVVEEDVPEVHEEVDLEETLAAASSASIAAVASASSLVEDEPAEAEETTVVEEGVPEVREGVDLEETLAATSSASVAAVASASSLVENEATEVEEATVVEEDVPEVQEKVDLEETLAAASEETIKIDPNRAVLFKEAQQIFAEVEGEERTTEQRQQQLDEFLEREDVGAMVQNDTSFGVFTKIAKDVMARGDEEATKEDKGKFLKDLTEKFGFLGEEVIDPANKQAEQVKMFEVYSKTYDNEKFGDIVVARFQEAFGPMIEAFREKAVGATKDGGKKGKAVDVESEVEDTATKQQKQNKEIDERDEKEKQDQKDVAAKARGKLLLEELTAGDVGKGVLAMTTIIVCSVMLPGVGTALALAAVSAAYVATAKGKPEQEKEAEEIDPQLASANAAIEAAMKRGRESSAGTSMSGVTQEFVAQNSQELEDEKKALEAKRSELVVQDAKGTKGKEQLTASASSEEREEEEVDSPDLAGLSPEEIEALKAATKALGAGATKAKGLEGSAIADDPNKARETELV